MLIFIDDKCIKQWFCLWEYKKEGNKYSWIKCSDKYPLDYDDSRFHAVYEKVISGNYSCFKHGKTPHNSKPIAINFIEAEKRYKPFKPLIENDFVIDWHLILNKGRKSNDKSLDNQQIEKQVNYFAPESDIALNKAIKAYRQGKPVPSFLLTKVLNYVNI